MSKITMQRDSRIVTLHLRVPVSAAMVAEARGVSGVDKAWAGQCGRYRLEFMVGHCFDVHAVSNAVRDTIGRLGE